MKLAQLYRKSFETMDWSSQSLYRNICL